MRKFSAASTEDMANSGSFLSVAGKFHVMIREVAEDPTRNEKIVRGFMNDVMVVTGEHKGESLKIYFQDPDSGQKDGGVFCKKKQTAALIATNVITPAQLGTDFEVDLNKAMDQQVCVEIKLGDADKNGKQWPDLAFANIYHVDDPRAKSFVKDPDILALIPKENRHDEAYFAPLLTIKKAAPTKQITEEDLEGL